MKYLLRIWAKQCSTRSSTSGNTDSISEGAMPRASGNMLLSWRERYCANSDSASDKITSNPRYWPSARTSIVFSKNWPDCRPFQKVFDPLVQRTSIHREGTINRLLRNCEFLRSVTEAERHPRHQHAVANHLLRKQRPKGQRRRTRRIQGCIVR